MMHPHPDQYHVMTIYRKHILSAKRKYGTARGLYAYKGLVEAYLIAKRSVRSINRYAKVKSES